MKHAIFFFFLLAACTKPAAPEPIPQIPTDFKTRYWINTQAARMYAGPDRKTATDTSIYFQGHVYYTIEGEFVAVCWSYPGYLLTDKELTFRHRQGPLKEVTETLKPTLIKSGFLKLESDYRFFWIEL